MPDMTDEEYAVLEKEVTKNPPKVTGDGTHGFFAGHKEDNVSATWLRIKAEVDHKTTSEIIGELVREKIAASV
jgi:hypothetical protein